MTQQSIDLPASAATSELAATPDVSMRGVHAGAVVFLGIAAANLGNYIFHFVSARMLGPSSYGDVASLVAVAGLLALPLGGVQVVVARYVAGYRARRDLDAISSFARRTFAISVWVGAIAAATLAAASLAIQHALDIESLTAVLLTAALAAPALLTPVAWGIAQGLQRFVLLALATAAGPLVRVAAVVALLSAGFGVAGAMGATLVASAVGLAVPVLVLRPWLRRQARAGGRIESREAARYLVPVLAGLLAITALSTVDVVVAKAALNEHEAGIYGSASLIGRVILYLPAAIVTVLLPKVAARAAARRETTDILRGSLGVTLAFCAAATLLYTAAPELVLSLAFGSAFDDARPLLWLFALAMSGYALLNVLLMYHLGHGSSRMSWLLLFGAAVEATAFGMFHGSPEQLLSVSIATAFSLLVLHEVIIDHSFTSSATSIARSVGRPRAK